MSTRIFTPKLSAAPKVKGQWLILGLILLGSTWFWRPSEAMGKGQEDRDKRRAAANTLFTNDVLHVLKITIPREGMQSLRKTPRAYVKATLRDGPLILTNLLVRLKGGAGSFRGVDDKPGLTVKLSEQETYHGLDKFHLNNSVQDPTYLSEWFSGELFRAAGVPAGRVAHAVVELNGRRLGPYIILESIEADFLSRYFTNRHGNLYSLGMNADISSRLERIGGREQTGGKELQALAAAAREPDLERLRARLPQVLDMSRFISFMAVEVMLDHWDGYTFNIKNYLVYHNVDDDKMVFIPHDLDQVLRDPNRPIFPRPEGIVSRAILRAPETRTRYRQRFEELYTNVFVAPALIQRIDDQVTKLAPTLRSYDAQMAREFISQAGELKDRVLRRARALDAQLKLPGPAVVKVSSNAVSVKGWRVANAQQNARQARVSDASGKKTLWIGASGPSGASWRARIPLEPGHYVFEGVVRTVGVQATSDDPKGEGAGLRVSGVSRSQGNMLVGNSSWRKLQFQFTVTDEDPETDLICELRAQKGEVWFDEESLKISRTR